MRAIVVLLAVLGVVGCGSSSGDAMGDGGSDAAAADVDAAVDCSMCSPECIGATQLSCGSDTRCSMCHPVCADQPLDLGPGTPNCDAPSGNATCTLGVRIYCAPR